MVVLEVEVILVDGGCDFIFIEKVCVGVGIVEFEIDRVCGFDDVGD